MKAFGKALLYTFAGLGVIFALGLIALFALGPSMGDYGAYDALDTTEGQESQPAN